MGLSKKKTFVERFFRAKTLDIVFLFLCVVLAGYAWRNLPQMVIRSDGFVHMLKSEQQRFWGQQYWIGGLELDASILGAILPKFFNGHVSSYMWFELVYALAIVALFYIVVRLITNNSIIAFISTIIAGVNYLGNWDMYGTHCYCFFLERVTNVPFMLVSFLFLHLYLTSQKMRYLLLSLFLYFVGLKLGHLALLFSPPFILYAFWWYFLQSWKKELWKGFLIGGAFAIISAGVVWMQQLSYPGWGPEWTFTEFILKPGEYLKVIAFQLTNWSQYFSILPNINSQNPLRDVDYLHVARGIPYVLFFYLIVSAIVYKKLSNYRAILLTCIMGFAGIIFLSYYVRPSEVVHPDSNRYLYYSTFFLSIFWGVVIWFFFFNKRRFFSKLGILIVFLFYYVNVMLIDYIVKQNIEWNRSTKALFDHVIQTRRSLPPSTLIVVSHPEFWVQEASFFTEQIGRGEVEYATEITNASDWRTLLPKYSQAISLRYDQTCNCVKEIKIK